MSVEGNLDLFQLPEILQVIAQQQKTGILTVQGPQDIVAISFLQGKIVAADALNQAAEEGLRKVLVGSGLLSPSEFSRAASEQLSSGQRLIDLLVERRFVSRPRLLEALRVQTIALLEQLLDWREGDFKFYGGDEVSFEEGFVPIAVTELLLHAGGSDSAPASPEPNKGRATKREAAPPAEAMRPSVASTPSQVERAAPRESGELLRPIGSIGASEAPRPVVVPFPTPTTSTQTQVSAQTLPSLSGSGGIRKVVVEPLAVPTFDRWVGRGLALVAQQRRGRARRTERPSPWRMARLGVPVGGRVKKPRAVEDQSAPIPREIASKLGRIIFTRSLRPCLGQGVSLGEEAVLADSGREGEIVAGVGRV